MHDSSVILFPHTFLTGRALKKILALFGRLTICQPWYMETPPEPAGTDTSSSVHILNPPPALKPKGDFKKLLSEYMFWIRQNPGIGYAASFNVWKTASSEDKPWEIRQMIRRGQGVSDVSPDNNTLKWHLILHLARELEENQMDAGEMLNQLKQEKSPLAGALEDASGSKGLLEDLTPTEAEPLMAKHRLRHIFEAWTGLFGEYLPDNGFLITLDQHVMDHAIDIFEDTAVKPAEKIEQTFSPELRLNLEHIDYKQLPLLADHGNSGIDPLVERLAGKIIVMLEA